MQIFRKQTSKNVKQFISDLDRVARGRGFVIHNEDNMEMAHTFGRHGAEVAEGFDLHMVQICKPEKAANSLMANVERAVLMPKFIMAFGHNGSTQVRFLYFNRDTVKELVDDNEFPGSLLKSYEEIISLIEEAA